MTTYINVIDGQTQGVVQVPVGNPNGQATMVDSAPVVIASNQTPIKVDGSATTQPVSGTVAVNGVATDATLLQVLNAIKAQVNINGLVFFDSVPTTPVYYIRRESVNEGTGVITTAWFNLDGTAANPSAAIIARLQSATNAQNLTTENVMFVASANGTGYVTGDILIHAMGIDADSATTAPAYNFWLNASSGVVLTTAPTGGTFAQLTQQVLATATDAKLELIRLLLAGTLTVGLPAGAATAAGVAAVVAASPLGIQPYTNARSVTLIGRTRRIAPDALAVTVGTYAAGNVVGGLLKFTGVWDAANSGLLQSIRARSKAVNAGTTFDLYLFASQPTASTFTDKAAPNINPADYDKVLGPYSLTVGKSGLGTHTSWTLDGIGAAIAMSSPDLYGVLIATGTVPQFASTSDLSLSIVAIED